MDRIGLMNIHKQGKLLKSDVIIAYNNYIIGTDINTIYFKVIKTENIINDRIVYISKDMDTFIKPITLLDNIEIKGPNIVCSTGTSIPIYNPPILNSTIFKINSIQNIISNKSISYAQDNLEKDKRFNEIINRKTGEGIEFYKINRKFLLSLFKGLLPINKNDKVSLKIIDIDKIKFLSIFSILKNKSKDKINVYIMYRHI